MMKRLTPFLLALLLAAQASFAQGPGPPPANPYPPVDVFFTASGQYTVPPNYYHLWVDACSGGGAGGCC